MRIKPWFALSPLPLLTLLAAACGDDDSSAAPDAGPDAMANPPDAVPFEPPTPTAVPLSAAGPDQLQAAVAGPGGSFYAVGFAAETLTGAKDVVVVKLTSAGIDTTWGGGDGVVSTGLTFAGSTDELDIAVQSTGQIIVSATVANEVEPLDTDVAITRLDADGAVDTDFGDGGVRVLDLNTGTVSGTTVTGGDRARGLALDASDRIYLHAIQLAPGRSDTDFVVLRLDAGGDLDSGFAGGKYLLDLRGSPPNNTPSNATARGIALLADGSVLAGGYATTEGLSTGAQPVLYKLDSNGAPVTAFANDGVFHDAVLSTQTEVYNLAIHGNHVVTAGYGRESGDQNDWVSLRFDVTTGVRDTTWGGAPNGVVTLDPSGNMVGDNCRNAIALPDGKTALLGSTGPGNDPAQDAVYAILDADGELDTAYGTGMHVTTMGSAAGNEQLWGGAVSGTHALFVGYRGGGPVAMQTDTMNDDAYVVILPLR